ncbi:MAG: rod shape-determining protein MreD [Bacillota bacterium]|nr:MAG: rod shape-determining protein MreD [Bacillota bacterium]
MRYWVLAAILGVAFLAQTTVAGFLQIGGVAPNLLQAVVVSYGLLFGSPVGAVAGALVGLLRDVAFGRYIGLSVLSLGAVGWVAGLVERRVYQENPLLPVLGGLLSTFLAEGIHYGVLRLLDPDLVAAAAVSRRVLPGALYTTAVTFLVYRRILRAYGYLRPEPGGVIRSVRRR